MGKPALKRYPLQTWPDDPLAVRHGVHHGQAPTVIKDYAVTPADADGEEGYASRLGYEPVKGRVADDQETGHRVGCSGAGCEG